DLTTALLAETGARALVVLAPERAEELTRLAGQHGVPVVRIGATGGSGIDHAGELSIDGAVLRQAHEGKLPEHVPVARAAPATRAARRRRATSGTGARLYATTGACRPGGRPGPRRA